MDCLLVDAVYVYVVQGMFVSVQMVSEVGLPVVAVQSQSLRPVSYPSPAIISLTLLSLRSGHISLTYYQFIITCKHTCQTIYIYKD